MSTDKYKSALIKIVSIIVFLIFLYGGIGLIARAAMLKNSALPDYVVNLKWIGLAIVLPVYIISARYWHRDIVRWLRKNYIKAH